MTASGTIGAGLRMAKAALPVDAFHHQPIDPTLSAEELLAIVKQLYRALGTAPRDRHPALTARIRAHADRYRQVDEQAPGLINTVRDRPHG